MFLCSNCNIQDSHEHEVHLQLRSEPLKMRLLKSLGLMKSIINHFVLKCERSEYKFPRRHLKFLETSTSNVPVIHFSKAHPPTSTVLIYSHGNGSNLNSIYSFAKRIHEIYGIAVVAYDYSGYGESNKEEINFQGDIKAVLAWVLDQGYQINRIILAGFSLGTYSTLLLRGIMPRLLIAPISGITPFFQGEIAHYKGEVFDNLKSAEKMNSRVVMVHSKKDDISIDHSRLLYRVMVRGTKPDNFSNIKFYEIDHPKHDQTPDYFMREMSKEFSQFISQINKDAKSPRKCIQTVKLVEQLKQLRNSMTVFQGDYRQHTQSGDTSF